jgi:putative transposase
MARPLRIEYPGAVHHITSRGNERRPIFRSDADREMFLSLLGAAVARFRWSVTAYVLMTNHFHFVVETPEPNLSRGMHWLNTSYVTWFNRRHKRSGHLFQGRFDSCLIEKATYFTQVLRYVVLNPVRARMVSRPEDYPWSSFRATSGLESGPSWLDLDSALALYGPDRSSASAAYGRFVVAHLDHDESLWDNVRYGVFLGSDPWMVQMRGLVESKPRSTEHPKTQRAVGRPAMTQIVDAVCSVTGLSRDEVRSNQAGSFRRLIAWLGWHEGLATLTTIGAALRLRSDGHVSTLIRRCEAEFSSDGRLLATHDGALRMLRA